MFCEFEVQQKVILWSWVIFEPSTMKKNRFRVSALGNLINCRFKPKSKSSDIALQQSTNFVNFVATLVRRVPPIWSGCLSFSHSNFLDSKSFGFIASKKIQFRIQIQGNCREVNFVFELVAQKNQIWNEWKFMHNFIS